MPLDPSIVSNAFANISQNMPDINSFANQRVQGAENIYKIERQRKADELVMEDRAAAAAKEQEDATIKALLPAYAHAYKTGDMKGAAKFAPAQYQEILRPYVEALDGRPLEEIQAAVIGSLSASPSGQEALAAIQRGQTFSVQDRQQKLAENRLAFDIEQANKPDAGDFIAVATDQGMYLLNKKTGKYTPMQPGETGIPGPRALPEGATAPAAPAAVTATPAVPTAPGAAATAPQPGILKPPPKAGSADQTQEERRRAAAVRYSIKNVSKVLQTIDKDPASFGQGADEFFLSLVPFGAAEDFKSFVQDANRQQVYYRMNQTVATLLRLATGAAYTGPELVTEANSFMPKYGDNSATARDKLDALEDRILSEVGSTGRGFTPEDQADLEKLLDVFATMKDKLYPVGDEGTGGATEKLPEGATSSNW